MGDMEHTNELIVYGLENSIRASRDDLRDDVFFEQFPGTSCAASKTRGDGRSSVAGYLGDSTAVGGERGASR